MFCAVVADLMRTERTEAAQQAMEVPRSASGGVVRFEDRHLNFVEADATVKEGHLAVSDMN